MYFFALSLYCLIRTHLPFSVFIPLHLHISLILILPLYRSIYLKHLRACVHRIYRFFYRRIQPHGHHHHSSVRKTNGLIGKQENLCLLDWLLVTVLLSVSVTENLHCIRTNCLLFIMISWFFFMFQQIIYFAGIVHFVRIYLYFINFFVFQH